MGGLSPRAHGKVDKKRIKQKIPGGGGWAGTPRETFGRKKKNRKASSCFEKGERETK